MPDEPLGIGARSGGQHGDALHAAKVRIARAMPFLRWRGTQWALLP
jgi:hypothetical protein